MPGTATEPLAEKSPVATSFEPHLPTRIALVLKLSPGTAVSETPSHCASLATPPSAVDTGLSVTTLPFQSVMDTSEVPRFVRDPVPFHVVPFQRMSAPSGVVRDEFQIRPDANRSTPS